jgi:hypothetical protein
MCVPLPYKHMCLYGIHKNNVCFFYTGRTRFTLGLGSWDFRRKMKRRKLKQKYNGNICKCIRFHSKIFSNQHKILKNVLFYEIYVLKIVYCLRKRKKIYYFKNDRIDACLVFFFSDNKL